MKHIKKVPILFLSLLVLTILVNAIVVEKATLEEITTESHLVVHGKILSKESVWEGKQINTYLTLEVYDVAKGELSGNIITVKQMGGTVGDISAEVTGSPHFYEGDEVFFFLVDWKNNYWIHSIALGGYSVIEVAGEKYAVNGFNDIEIAEPLYKKQGEELKGEYSLFDLFGKVQSLNAQE